MSLSDRNEKSPARLDNQADQNARAASAVVQLPSPSIAPLATAAPAEAGKKDALKITLPTEKDAVATKVAGEKDDVEIKRLSNLIDGIKNCVTESKGHFKGPYAENYQLLFSLIKMHPAYQAVKAEFKNSKIEEKLRKDLEKTAQNADVQKKIQKQLAVLEKEEKRKAEVAKVEQEKALKKEMERKAAIEKQMQDRKAIKAKKLLDRAQAEAAAAAAGEVASTDAPARQESASASQKSNEADAKKHNNALAKVSRATAARAARKVALSTSAAPMLNHAQRNPGSAGAAAKNDAAKKDTAKKDTGKKDTGKKDTNKRDTKNGAAPAKQPEVKASDIRDAVIRDALVGHLAKLNQHAEDKTFYTEQRAIISAALKTHTQGRIKERLSASPELLFEDGEAKEVLAHLIADLSTNVEKKSGDAAKIQLAKTPKNLSCVSVRSAKDDKKTVALVALASGKTNAEAGAYINPVLDETTRVVVGDAKVDVMRMDVATENFENLMELLVNDLMYPITYKRKSCAEHAYMSFLSKFLLSGAGVIDGIANAPVALNLAEQDFALSPSHHNGCQFWKMCQECVVNSAAYALILGVSEDLSVRQHRQDNEVRSFQNPKLVSLISQLFELNQIHLDVSQFEEKIPNQSFEVGSPFHRRETSHPHFKTVVSEEKSGAGRDRVQTMDAFVSHLETIKALAQTLLVSDAMIATSQTGAANVFEFSATDDVDFPELDLSKLENAAAPLVSPRAPASTRSTSPVMGLTPAGSGLLFFKDSAAHEAIAQLKKEQETASQAAPAIAATSSSN